MAAPAAAPTAHGADMAAMDMSADAKMAKGTGTAVSADSVTIDHAPIPEARHRGGTGNQIVAGDIWRRSPTAHVG